MDVRGARGLTIKGKVIQKLITRLDVHLRYLHPLDLRQIATLLWGAERPRLGWGGLQEPVLTFDTESDARTYLVQEALLSVCNVHGRLGMSVRRESFQGQWC